MPQLVLDCIASWHRLMPEWTFMKWDEDNFDVSSHPYVKEAYEARKFAFVSDYVRLYALYNHGGLYLDVDFEVFKPFDDLLDHPAFAGYEGSKHSPVMMGVLASEQHGSWVAKQMGLYAGRHFVKSDGAYDMTTNVAFLTVRMMEHGLVCDGLEKDFDGLHIFPVDFLCPKQTTGEYFKTENTYCDHKGLDSWSNQKKPLILRIAGPKLSIKLIKLKRRIFG